MTSHEKQGIFYSNPQNGQSKIPINFYLNEGHVDGVETEVITEIQPVTQTGSPTSRMATILLSCYLFQTWEDFMWCHFQIEQAVKVVVI